MAKDDWFFILEPDGKSCDAGKARAAKSVGKSSRLDELQSQVSDYVASIKEAARQAGVTLR